VIEIGSGIYHPPGGLCVYYPANLTPASRALTELHYYRTLFDNQNCTRLGHYGLQFLLTICGLFGKSEWPCLLLFICKYSLQFLLTISTRNGKMTVFRLILIMFVLSTGKSTGKIVHTLSDNGIIINTAHYSVEECNQGMHYHENPHICFLLQGEDIESRNNLSYQRKTGEIYFYHAGETHGSISRKSISKTTNIEFGKSFLGQYEVSEAQIERALRNNLDAKFLILKMQQEMLINDNCSQPAIQTLLLNLINDSKNVENQSTPKWVALLANLLNDKWNEPITLQELSSATEKHPITISKHFRKYFSCTLGEYLRKLKIEKSIPLIKNSCMSLTEIALHCGFADQSHFTRSFKQMTGFLPKDFRNI
jgi:AraC family transcriptional regulator